MTRIERNQLKKIGRPGLPEAAVPAGISPVLRPSWKFAKNLAERFNRELLNDRVDEFLKNLAKRFT